MMGALLIILIGVLFFTQTSVGDAVKRIGSFTPDGDEPDNAGPRASGFTPGRAGRGALRIRVGVKRGDPFVRDVISGACARAGGGFTCISWHRPGSITAGGNKSCHRHGKTTRKGAMDLIPDDGDWDRADDLVRELHRTAYVGEVIFRNDADHDPALGANPPHVHAAVNCG